MDRNASGYYDPTAFRALKRLEKEERNKMSMVKPYEIWRAKFPNGNLVPVLVLWSDEKCTTITRLMEQLPEKHGPAVSVTGGALDLSKISYLYVSEFKNRIRVLDPNEEECVKNVLAESFGIMTGTGDELTELEDLRTLSKDLKAERDKLRDQLETVAADHTERTADVEERIRSLREAVTNLKTERDRLSIQLDVYRDLYANLLGKVMEG